MGISVYLLAYGTDIATIIISMKINFKIKVNHHHRVYNPETCLTQPLVSIPY